MADDIKTPHQKYLRFADRTIGLEGKDVLEVGGCSPPDLLQALAPRSWTCANLSTAAVAEFNASLSRRPTPNYAAQVLDITKLEATNAFDIAYSINSFEHIHDVARALERIRQALRQGGYLFTIFGPIWSSDVGHHLSIPTDDGGGLYYYDGVLEPWEHLTSSRESLKRRLADRYGVRTAERAIDYIYDYGDLNRLYEGDYIDIVRKSGLSPVLIVRNKKGKPPGIGGGTRTREFLMVLRNGPTTAGERAMVAARCGWAIAAHLLG